MTKESIQKWHNKSTTENTFEKFGGIQSLTKAIKNGMVFVTSLWDDQSGSGSYDEHDVANMTWLDGVNMDRGPCTKEHKRQLRSRFSSANFTNWKY